MKKLHKALAATALGLGMLVPSGIALAQDATTTTTPSTTVAPTCTPGQHQERMAAHEQLRAEILDQLRKEGVTDPAQVAEQLRIRLHAAMAEAYGEMGGPGMAAGAGMGQGMTGMGQGMTGMGQGMTGMGQGMTGRR